MLEVANVAVSAGPLGGPPVIQLAALFQFTSAGLAFQVALPAKLLAVARTNARVAAAEGRKAHPRESLIKSVVLIIFLSKFDISPARVFSAAGSIC